MTIIRTVLGDIAPEALGVCLPHEHVYGQPPAAYADTDLTLDDVDAAADELRLFHAAGGRAMVEMTTPDYGRSAGALERISRASGVHLIAASGHNQEKYSAPFFADDDIETIARCFAAEVLSGMDGTTVRAGVIKASSTLNAISPLAEKLFHAAAQAHHMTGAPISTHTEAGTMALEQVALLTGDGVPPNQIIIGHTDRKQDLDYHLRLAETGVFMGHDQIGKARYAADRERAELIVKLIQRGCGRQILLAGDHARRSGWVRSGGAGYAHVLTAFVPLLLECGASPAEVDDLLIHNPARALAFTPPLV